MSTTTTSAAPTPGAGESVGMSYLETPSRKFVTIYPRDDDEAVGRIVRGEQRVERVRDDALLVVRRHEHREHRPVGERDVDVRLPVAPEQPVQREQVVPRRVDGQHHEAQEQPRRGDSHDHGRTSRTVVAPRRRGRPRSPLESQLIPQP